MFRGFRRKGKDEDLEAKKPLDDEQLIDDEDGDDWGDLEYEEDETPLGSRKSRILRGIRSFAISVAVLTVLAGGAGAAYIWYLGENSDPNSAAIAKPATAGVHREITPTKHDPNEPFGASIQMLSSPVTPGSNAGVTIKSVDGVTCKIIVEINKVALKDSGLVDKATDDYGVLSWSWTVPADAPLGKWPVKITCTSTAKKSAMVQGDMEIVKTLPEN